jgi:choline dehydrogenase-like flavoprotein
VTGLRVIDTSSLPFSAPGHTQGVTYAHAEKLAQDFINAAWLQSESISMHHTAMGMKTKDIWRE